MVNGQSIIYWDRPLTQRILADLISAHEGAGSYFVNLMLCYPVFCTGYLYALNGQVVDWEAYPDRLVDSGTTFDLRIQKINVGDVGNQLPPPNLRWEDPCAEEVPLLGAVKKTDSHPELLPNI